MGDASGICGRSSFARHLGTGEPVGHGVTGSEGRPMTEAERPACDHPAALLKSLEGKVSD
jgi:hypothetical protein